MHATSLNILHVEDNSDHACLVSRTLQRHKIPSTVRLVDDGQQAIDYLFQSGEFSDPQRSPRPHLVLLDLRLPKVDGLEVLRTIKTTESLLHIPVVVLTSSEADKDILQAYEHHVNSYLVKPLGFAEFTKMIEALGTYWLTWNRQP